MATATKAVIASGKAVSSGVVIAQIRSPCRHFAVQIYKLNNIITKNANENHTKMWRGGNAALRTEEI